MFSSYVAGEARTEWCELGVIETRDKQFKQILLGTVPWHKYLSWHQTEETILIVVRLPLVKFVHVLLPNKGVQVMTEII